MQPHGAVTQSGIAERTSVLNELN